MSAIQLRTLIKTVDPSANLAPNWSRFQRYHATPALISVNIEVMSGMRQSVEAVPQKLGSPSAFKWIGIQSGNESRRPSNVAAMSTRLTMVNPATSPD